MEVYSTEELINSILRISFRQKHYVERAQLNRIAYQTAREIFIKTGRRPIKEAFTLNFNGPALPSVNVYYLQIHSGRKIEEYMKDYSEKAVFIEDPDTVKIIDKVWNEAKCMPLHSMLSDIPTTDHPLLNDSGGELLMAG